MKTIMTTMVACALALPAMASVNPTDAERAKCFIDNPQEKTLTFIMDNSLWKVSGISKMEVLGSFNGWKSNPAYQMTFDSERNFWYVTLSYAQVKVPGNSGQPEFKFVTNGSNYLNGGSKSFIPEGYVFLNGDKNNIVVFDDDDFETIKENSRTANIIKKLSDFDLTTTEGQEAISNFRRVPGTANLFRSYHPYKITKNTNATEPYRMKYVVELATAKGITCDICLSENEERNLQSFTIAGTPYKETIPEYYEEIIRNGNVLYVGAGNSVPTYNEVYYSPDNGKFGNWMKEVVEFIIDDSHPGPFQIHCRIGTDRTGAFSGTLGALCGATWNEIAADYQLSNRMGTQEFRDYHLLQYGFQKLLGVEDINGVPDLQQAMSDYFVNNGYLTEPQIEALRVKLKGIESEVAALTDSTSSAACEVYTLQGIKVADNTDGLAPGLYIIRRGDSSRKIAIR